jgi:hypothetical protein
MKLAELFHGVKNGAVKEKVAFWGLCKQIAAGHPRGVSVGLSKIAYEIWADGYERGYSSTRSREEREAFAGSFGSAVAVEGGLAKMAQEGRITDYDQIKMLDWVAESAVNDLVELTKTADAMAVLRRPEVIGGVLGTATGAGLGAWSDPEDRVRGAIAGAVPGGLAGTALGYGYRTHQEALKALADIAKEKEVRLAEQAAQKAFQEKENLLRADRVADAFHEALARVKVTNIPQLTGLALADLQAHAAAGHSGLPASVRQAMVAATPKERLAIEKAYHQLLHTGIKKKASRQKLADILQGLDEGGQPPMNADAPMGSAEEIGEAQGSDPEMEGLNKANKVVDNMIFLANQVNLPQLAQQMDQMRDQLASHFAEGHAYLPAELQHHFAQSEHADAFMKKYKQRFGSPNSGSKKAASFMEPLYQKVDELRGRAPGGIDMEEVRKRVPDARYIGLHADPDGTRRPAFASTSLGRVRTWDPAKARAIRNADPKGFYLTLAGENVISPSLFSQISPESKTAEYDEDAGDYPEIHLTAEQLENLTPAHARHLLGSPINYSPESFERLHELSQKTSSAQDAWLSWRTHR